MGFFVKKRFIRFGAPPIFLVVILFWFSLPTPLFTDPVSTVITDSEGNLLGAKIAQDEQWRFPMHKAVPSNFEKAIVCFEDKRFYNHLGFDLLALARAVKLNVLRGSVKSGGSTISMQVIRLSRKGKPRTLFEKIIELILALRLELSYSKNEILNLYASNAPFGGNIVGLDAAAWKYFERPADLLSVGESATLAVLPNAPSLIHPNKNRDLLKAKRNRLLDRMFEQELLDSLSWILAKEEPLPNKSKPLPTLAPHLLQRVINEKSSTDENTVVRTTLNSYLQNEVNRISGSHHERLKQNGIFNLAAIVAKVGTGEVLAYVGNSPSSERKHGYQVDIIPSRRSSGSVFKPFLYANMLTHGQLQPHQLIPDIPTNFSGYTPKNFDYKYSGAVPADEALNRSLNVPSIRMLSEFGINQFHATLKKVGFQTVDRPTIEYGLSLVVGGAECSLWDLAGAYAGMARQMSDNVTHFFPLNFYNRVQSTEIGQKHSVEQYPLDKGAIWHTLEALIEVKRPLAESYWRQFSSSGKVAWKTGTSFGFRDAWSVGCNKDYVVAVWCGNADGEGRPELIGVRAAAPIMFDIFNVLGPTDEWFDTPYDDMRLVNTCQKSGFKAGRYCTEQDTLWSTRLSLRSRSCPYHKPIMLDQSMSYRVHDQCASPQNMQRVNYFVLPPIVEKYYKRKNPNYKKLPPYRADCFSSLSSHPELNSLELLYPKPGTSLSIPTELDETQSSVVFEASHREKNAVIYWHLDEVYIGKTAHFHEMALNPEIGQHVITLVDQNGETISSSFTVHP